MSVAFLTRAFLTRLLIDHCGGINLKQEFLSMYPQAQKSMRKEFTEVHHVLTQIMALMIGIMPLGVAGVVN